MSEITAKMMSRELLKLYEEAFPAFGGHFAMVEENFPEDMPFIARIGEETFKFTVPVHALLSAPLDYVVDLYLRPLIAKAPPPI